VEQGDVDDVLSAPSQPYTQRLLAASTYSTAAVDA
jgi:ABC-type microcin C transport system duplicated ATPase subunit YejF